MTAAEMFRCAYCGELVPLARASVHWTWADRLDGDIELFAPAVYCSAYCGATHTTGAVGRS